MHSGKHIFLCGFMGCGKSTHGKKMASILKCGFVDLDRYIQEKENKTIQFIFENEGEHEFRKLESHYLKEVIKKEEQHIISLGGGTVCFNNNLEVVKKNGILVYIEMPAKALAVRLQKSHQYRPLLNGLTPLQLPDFIENKLNERNQFYRQADIITDGVNINYLQLQRSILEIQK